MAVDKVRSLVGKDMIIGVSTQTVEQAIQAEKDGNSSYRNYIIDAIYRLTSEELERGAKYEIR